MTSNPYGPDKPCRRTACIEKERAALRADGNPAADALDIADHLGGAHLNPADRQHYDGISISYNAAPLAVKEATRDLLSYVDAFGRRMPDTEVPLRPRVEIAIQACLNEIDQLRRQVAAVRVDADRRERAAMDLALSRDAHGAQLAQAADVADAHARAHHRAEEARLALLAQHQAIGDFVTAYQQAEPAGRPAKADTIVAMLQAMHTKTSAAHARAWNTRTPAKRKDTP